MNNSNFPQVRAQLLKLTALDGEKAMKSSSSFSLIGDPLQTKQEASASGEAARTVILMYAITNRIGINVGQHSIRGFAIYRFHGTYPLNINEGTHQDNASAIGADRRHTLVVLQQQHRLHKVILG